MIYKDIHECPIKVFHRIVETGDVMLLEYNDKGDKNTLEELDAVFSKMNDDIVDYFGVSDEFELYYHKQKTILKLEFKIIEGDKSAETILELNKQDLARLEKRLSKSNISDLAKDHVRLRRSVESEFKSNMDKMTVFEFYTNIQDIKEAHQNKELQEGSLRKSG